MQIESGVNAKIDTQQNPKNWRSKTIDRISYEAEVDIIRQQIGDLEDIRFRLGLSARKMAQLLLVDPSAWTRWTKKITPPPPHVYRALQWYLTLQEKNPGFTPQVFLATHWHSSQRSRELQKDGLLAEMEELKLRIQDLEKETLEMHRKRKMTPPWMLGLLFLIGGIAGFSLSFLSL